ncbi:RNA polymerase sigma factor [Deminuibacter soli]|uniref:RNA polymerase subunit sigma-24 n=1 Tax=Deminuibacter soli TaxID=2291815 RepID=A0A3E1NE98_9BACT|nr:sigma-70 family RNA polymerase sigma factor [Deminuibacter soli]RFM26289.1 RNA polymerase subunit sigma-24 [Deminuibacter soli]
MRKMDIELVGNMQLDDVSAFDELYWKYHQPVYRNVIKLIKEPEVAEDILQEVFIRLWENRAKLDPTQSVAGWLFVISFNLSVNYTRKRMREQALHKSMFSSAQEQAADFQLYERQHKLLETAIAQLSPQKKKIVTLCKLEGKTYEEAANELNISRHTVKEYLSSAMVNLNDYIKSHAREKDCMLLLLAFMAIQ